MALHGATSAKTKEIQRAPKSRELGQGAVGPHWGVETPHEGGLGLEVAPVGGCRPGAREAITQNGAMSKAGGGAREPREPC